jgi:mycothiol system anti-sigma-R factor
MSTQVWLFLDHECGSDRRALLEHLGRCDRCWAVFSLEARLKELLAHACGNERAPEELHARLRELIRATVRAERRRGEPPRCTDEATTTG